MPGKCIFSHLRFLYFTSNHHAPNSSNQFALWRSHIAAGGNRNPHNVTIYRMVNVNDVSKE